VYITAAAGLLIFILSQASLRNIIALPCRRITALSFYQSAAFFKTRRNLFSFSTPSILLRCADGWGKFGIGAAGVERKGEINREHKSVGGTLFFLLHLSFRIFVFLLFPFSFEFPFLVDTKERVLHY
jgi:hypothetical protein